MSTSTSNAMGLDVGTSRIVTARPDGKEGYQFRSQLNAFVTIPYSKMTERVLDKEGVPHSVNGSQIVVHGNECEKFADLMDTEIRRPMTGGVLDAKEPESISMMKEIIGSLINKNAPEKPLVCFTVPAATLDSSDSLTYTKATVNQILTQLPSQNHPLNQSLPPPSAEH